MSSNIPTHSICSIFLDQDLLTNFQSGSNTFIYDFAPRTVWTTPETKMSVANFSVPYSWFNITAAFRNNTFAYVWYSPHTTDATYGSLFPNAGTGTGEVYFVTIPDGYYDVASLNSYLQYTMIGNGHYLVDANGNFVYFLEFVLNVTIYRTQINSYQLPTTLPAGWTDPNGIYTGGTNTGPFSTPQLLLSNTNADTGSLFAYFGFSSSPIVNPWPPTNNFPAPRSLPLVNTPNPSAPWAFYNVIGNFAPHVTQVHSVCLTCSAIDNPLRTTQQHQVSTKVLTTQSVNVPFGQNMVNSNFFTSWIPLTQNSQLNQLQFTLTDQEGNLLNLQDADTNIELLITNLKY